MNKVIYLMFLNHGYGSLVCDLLSAALAAYVGFVFGLWLALSQVALSHDSMHTCYERMYVGKKSCFVLRLPACFVLELVMAYAA